MSQERIISFFGLFAMLGFAWLMSSHKKKVSPRIVLGGLALQVLLAVLILKTEPGRVAFKELGDFFTGVLDYSEAGAKQIFEVYPPQAKDNANVETWAHPATLLRTFAFGVLPTIIFFSALMAILYHLGLMQFIVNVFAKLMQKTLGTSGAETLSAAANIFVGQTEAPLVIRPYVNEMTLSELNVVMVGGFATIAGGVLAAYVGFGFNAGHLMTASVISAPAALMIAKILQPETEVAKIADGATTKSDETAKVNVIEAAAEGASSGLMLALNVGAMLIAAVALVAMGDAIVGWIGKLIVGEQSNWSLTMAFGYVFAPFAWLMGIPVDECLKSGEILGKKMVVNEFMAYIDLSGAREALRPRTYIILTYALCGFANFSSIGIQLGGIGGIAPQRRGDLAKLGFRAMLGGTLAAFMTACVAGVIISNEDAEAEAKAAAAKTAAEKAAAGEDANENAEDKLDAPEPNEDAEVDAAWGLPETHQVARAANLPSVRTGLCSHCQVTFEHHFPAWLHRYNWGEYNYTFRSRIHTRSASLT